MLTTGSDVAQMFLSSLSLDRHCEFIDIPFFIIVTYVQYDITIKLDHFQQCVSLGTLSARIRCRSCTDLSITKLA